VTAAPEPGIFVTVMTTNQARAGQLPAAAILIQAARTATAEAATGRRDPARAARRALDQWAPAIDQLADAAAIAAYLGISPRSISRIRLRTRADGTSQWPEPDGRFGRSDVWTYRTIILHRAAMPGRGHPGSALGRRRSDRPAGPEPGGRAALGHHAAVS